MTSLPIPVVPLKCNSFTCAMARLDKSAGRKALSGTRKRGASPKGGLGLVVSWAPDKFGLFLLCG